MANLLDDDVKIESEDEEDEVQSSDVEEHVSGKGRLGFRMKKFWATKVATSKAGRKAINHFLGAEGVQMLASLQSAIQKSSDKKVAEHLVKIILLLAFKLKLLFDENQLTAEDTKPTITPINDCVIRLNDALHSEKLEEGQLKLLSAKFTLLEELVSKTLRPLIKPKNVNKFHEVVQFLGDPKFLDQVCNQEAWSPEKKAIAKAIETLIKPLLEQRGLLESGGPDPCAVPGCDGEGCMKEIGGKFRGSRLCPRHHLLMFKELTSKPPMAVHFVLGEGKDYEPYQRLVGQKLPEFYARFFAAMYNFRRESYGIMRLPPHKAKKLFAEAMYEKFLHDLAPCPVAMSPEVKERVRRTVKPRHGEEAKELTTEVYDECYKIVGDTIQTTFLKYFGNTSAYEEYLEAITLPERLLEAAQAGLSKYRPRPPPRKPEAEETEDNGSAPSSSAAPLAAVPPVAEVSPVPQAAEVSPVPQAAEVSPVPQAAEVPAAEVPAASAAQ